MSCTSSFFGSMSIVGVEQQTENFIQEPIALTGNWLFVVQNINIK